MSKSRKLTKEQIKRMMKKAKNYEDEIYLDIEKCFTNEQLERIRKIKANITYKN